MTDMSRHPLMQLDPISVLHRIADYDAALRCGRGRAIMLTPGPRVVSVKPRPPGRKGKRRPAWADAAKPGVPVSRLGASRSAIRHAQLAGWLVVEEV